MAHPCTWTGNPEPLNGWSVRVRLTASPITGDPDDAVATGTRLAARRTDDDAAREVLAEYATAYDAEVARVAARYRIPTGPPSP